jgi:hypothetical protein
MSQYDATESIADLFRAASKDPMFKKTVRITVYPNEGLHHHKGGAVFVAYGDEDRGAGYWTTMLGLAKALIIADEKRRE